MAASADGAHAQERRCGGASQQAGTDRLGGATARRGFQGCSRQSGGVVGRPGTKYRPASDICWWWKRDGLTVDRRAGYLFSKMVLDTVGFMRTGTRGSPS